MYIIFNLHEKLIICISNAGETLKGTKTNQY